MFKKGFTLIELLVVIAIIAILAAILFPVFAQAREKARAATCLSNMKQVALAFQLYADDYDETYPRSVSTPAGAIMNDNPAAMIQILNPYVKNIRIFACPSVTKENELYASSSHQYHVYYTTPSSNYLWNGIIFEDADSEGRVTVVKTMATLNNSSNLIACIEGNFAPIWERLCYMANWYGYWANDYNGSYGGQGNTYNAFWIWGAKHNGGTNCSFMDGHAKYYKVTALSTDMFGFTHSDGSVTKYGDNPNGLIMDCNLNNGDKLIY